MHFVLCANLTCLAANYTPCLFRLKYQIQFWKVMFFTVMSNSKLLCTSNLLTLVVELCCFRLLVSDRLRGLQGETCMSMSITNCVTFKTTS